MRKSLCSLAAVLLLAVAAPAQAPRRTAAVLPVAVFRGPAENGTLMAEAIRENLTRHGMEVVSEDRVQAALEAQKMDLSRMQTTVTLNGVREELGVDYVVYTRILTVGMLAGTDDYQATTLLNVQGKSLSSFVHTCQAAQTIKEENSAGQLMLKRAEANEAAPRLLNGFYSRVK